MLENTAAITARSVADTAPPQRRIARVDGRLKAARRVKELIAGFKARLGNAGDPATLAAIAKAAELVALGEDQRGKALRGEPVDLAALVKVENAAARAVAALDHKAHQPAHVVPLRERLAAELAAEQAAE